MISWIRTQAGCQPKLVELSTITTLLYPSSGCSDLQMSVKSVAVVILLVTDVVHPCNT